MSKQECTQFWLWKSTKATFAYKEPRNEPGEIRVIVYSEYEKIVKELAELRKKLEQSQAV